MLQFCEDASFWKEKWLFFFVGLMPIYTWHVFKAFIILCALIMSQVPFLTVQLSW